MILKMIITKVNLLKSVQMAFIAPYGLLIWKCSTLLAFLRVLWQKELYKGQQGGDNHANPVIQLVCFLGYGP